MRATGSLSTVEWQALFPTPDTQGNSATFDVPLLFNLIREFSDLKQPQPNWMDDVARDRDKSLSADIVKIVQCYRFFCNQKSCSESGEPVILERLSIVEDVMERRSPVIREKFQFWSDYRKAAKMLPAAKIHEKEPGNNNKIIINNSNYISVSTEEI